MKRILAAAAALAMAAVLAAGCAPKAVQNKQQGSPAPVLSAVPFSGLQAPALDTVDFISDTVGYVGGQGIIFKSADGGQTWTKLYTCPDNVVSVDAVDADNVWAATSNYLLHSTDGRSFQRVNPDITAGQNGKDVSAIDFLSADQGYILADGVIWRLASGDKVQRATPPGRVDSMSFGDSDTGFASSSKVVYKTCDGGRTWTMIFTAPVAMSNVPNQWRSAIRAGSAMNAWLMVYGGDAGMSQSAYVVFHTTDGTNFTPVMEEGYFASDYPTIDVKNNPNIGGYPGAFMVLGEREAFFTGWDPVRLLLISTVDNGKSFNTIDIGAHIDNLPDYNSPFGISFTDTMHGCLAGTRNGQGIILRTMDGATFQAVP